MNITKKIAKHKLLKTREKDLATYEIIESFLTQKINEGETWRRDELVRVQQKIEEYKKFISFVKSL